ncbi:MAG: hypothetical protein WC865_06900 [Bacteroidales bacterium]
MKNWIYFLIALILYMVIHEDIHVVVSLLYGEYHSIVIHWYGPQVIFVTPVAERIPDIKWFAISGVSNFATLLAGYILYSLKKKINLVKSTHLRSILYYVTIVFLLFDAINLSLGPFFYGGDINGISAGLKIKPWIIQILFGCVLMINRELIVKYMNFFGVSSSNILFKSWYNK